MRTPDHLSRRDFLSIAAGMGLSWLLSACRLKQERTQTQPQPVSETPNIERTTSSAEVSAQPSEQSARAAPAAPEQAADTVILDARVLTMDSSGSVVQALAVRNGMILALGADEQIKPFIGQTTRVIDAGKKVVSPGFIDPHIHYAVAGLMDTYYIPFLAPQVTDVASMQVELARRLKDLPAGEWLLGVFFTMKGKMPDRYDLDRVSPRHPVWMTQQGGHFGVANSQALKIAGVNAATPNPSGGIIERGPNNEPTGVFYNHRSMDVLRRVIPKYTAETVNRGMRGLQPAFLAAGVTSLQDNNVRDPENMAVYRSLAESGQLKIRSAIYYTLEWSKDLDTALNLEAFEGPFARFAGFKFLIDGTAPTAFCNEKHSGASWDLSTWEAAEFKKTVRALHDTGLQICVHCYGDAAADLTLDAFEEAMNANPRPDPRHRIEHAVITSAEATRHCKDLGVVIQYNPTFIHLAGDYWPTQFSPEQMRRILVAREWLENDVRLTMGSDFPSTPWLKPQATMAAAMWRETPSKKALGQEHNLTFMEALRAHTSEAAYAAHEETLKGSLEAGKLADLILWSKDPTSADPRALVNWPDMALTMVGGEIVHNAG